MAHNYVQESFLKGKLKGFFLENKLLMKPIELIFISLKMRKTFTALEKIDSV